MMVRLTIFFLLILLSGFSILQIMGPGIEDPSPVGPYLNGVFQDTPPSGPTGFATTNAFPNITFNSPFKIIKDPRGDRFFVAEKRGRISIFSTANGGSNYETVVDFQDQVSQGGGTHGLMGFALHPEFGQEGSPNRNYFYVFYRHIPAGHDIAGEGNSYRRLSRFTMLEGRNQARRSSEQIMIQQFVRSRIHSGGGMIFDKKGFMVLGLGDGGNCCEQASTQRLDRWLLGGIIRIDVDKKGGVISHPIRRQPTNYDDASTNFPSNWEDSYSQHYYIPNDNPWQDPSGGTLEEFYALGIRHAYTLVYDKNRDEIWEGEIGQSTWEEINKIKKGHNYEWPFLEAVKVHRSTLSFSPFNINQVTGPRQGPHVRLNRATSKSVILGLVYRGNKHSILKGNLLFADHAKGTIYSIKANSNSDMTQDDIDPVAVLPGCSGGFGIASFSTDSNGEIYIVKLNGVNYNPLQETRGGGTIHKLVPDLSNQGAPTLLSATGAFKNLNTLTPADGIIPYTVNSPLWSDGSRKNRWIALPNDGNHNTAAEKIVFEDDEPWKFPEGTVLIKHFELPTDANNPFLTRRLETRFIIIGKGGEHYGLTYKWNEAQTDAELVLESESIDVTVRDEAGVSSIQTWTIPSRIDCMTCHTEVAGRVLGVNTHQLNGSFAYPSGLNSNQLETWNHLGMFDKNIGDPTDYHSSVKLENNNATSSNRIFSYLDANCGHCHHPTGVEGAFDARFPVPFDQRKMIDEPNQGENSVPGGVVVKPGSPSQSELFIRDNGVGGTSMPPLAKSLIDQPYIDQLRSWILELKDDEVNFEKIGEVGRVSTNQNWKKVNLQRSYTNPVVVVGGLSYDGTQAAFARVRRANANSFEIKVEEWECMDVTHLDEQLSYLVVEAGRHRLTNGKYLEAGNLTEVTHDWKTYNYSNEFNTNPVVLAQITTDNQAFANVRLNHAQTDKKGLSVKVQDAKRGNRSPETVSWVAMASGSQKKGFAFEAGTETGFNSDWKQLSFDLAYSYDPIFMGFVGSFNGGDPVSLRYDKQKLNGNSVKVFLQEEECEDSEVVHTNETLNYFLFERAGFLFGKPEDVSLRAAVKLEGPFDPISGLMDDLLRTGGLLEDTDPYGLGEITSSEILGRNGNDAIVDWMKLEARSASNPATILVEQAVLLQRDGQLISAQGIASISFNNLPPGSYYIAVSHYNHLPVMTGSPIDLSQSPSIDFTKASTPIYDEGGYVLKNDNGTMLLWAGDANGDGVVNAVDKNQYWRIENGAPYIYGVTKGDFNVDGNVNALDKNRFWKANNSMAAPIL